MEDCLFPLPTFDETAHLVEQVSILLRDKGFNLNKWITNDESFLQKIPEANQAKLADKGRRLNFFYQRVLRVLWNTTDDCFRFRVYLRKGPFTRRDLITILSSRFDPWRFAAPLLVIAR